MGSEIGFKVKAKEAGIGLNPGVNFRIRLLLKEIIIAKLLSPKHMSSNPTNSKSRKDYFDFTTDAFELLLPIPCTYSTDFRLIRGRRSGTRCVQETTPEDIPTQLWINRRFGLPFPYRDIIDVILEETSVD